MARAPYIPPTPSEEAYRVDEDQGEVFTRDDPFALFEEWFELAKTREPNDANAMALATADSAGRPDVRIVLLKDVSPQGFSFYSSEESAKGNDLAANPRAALCFHWKTIRRQVRVRGPVSFAADADTDRYFAERARGARIAAHASAQSRPVDSVEALRRRYDEAVRAFEGKDVPRPAYWRGYVVEPSEIEFWVNRPFRLHDRLLFARDGAGWRTKRLYP
ncbi:MAG: pyridoxamine 5'-phosphate oxidase [Pseudomonadota bacterium]|nr:pyridoxamine 5'-phosphate oxidase [Pseudomonadota bacterium]